MTKYIEKTASELIQERRKDPEWVAREEKREAEIREREEAYLAHEAPLREALHAMGYPVKWVWDFVNSKENYYIDAIPLLIEHLGRPYPDDVREGIARSLAVKEARGRAGAALVALLREDGLGQQLRWAAANTLTTVADRSNYADIKSLIDAETNADVSERLVRALKKATKP